ncbi:MAG: hypothetical protein ABMA25_19515 [Ilumatobacteraceae bacterium]
MYTTPVLTPFATPFQTRTTPAVVTGARVITIIQASVLLASGALLLLGGVTGLGIASLVEGALRLGLAIALRRGARRVRQVLLVLCAISAGVGFMAGGLARIGALINLVIARFLAHDDAKAWCAA